MSGFKKNLAPSVDLQFNAHVCLPGSFHSNGKQYKWRGGKSLLEIEPALLPDWINSLAERAESNGDSTAAGADKQLIDELYRENPPIYPASDAEKVIAGCAILKHCVDNAATLSEPEWKFGTINVLAHCVNGEDAVHKYSSSYSKYSHTETQEKINYAKKAGPTLCETLQGVFGDKYCKGCPLEKKKKSPIILGYPAQKDWTEPQQVKIELAPVEPFNFELLPDNFREYVQDVSHRMQCPPDFTACAVMIILATVIGAGCGIKPKKSDDWLVVPNLWGCVVGRPGMLKSPALDEALKALKELERLAKEAYDNASCTYEVEEAAFKAQKDALKEQMKSAAKDSAKKGDKPNIKGLDELKEAYKQLVQEPMPTWKRYRTNDATIEKLGDLLAQNPRGLLVFRDELTGQLVTWDKDGHEQDRQFFLEAWKGYGSFVSDRIGRGTIQVDNMCISLFGGCQPDRLTSYLYKTFKGGQNDGLIQRFQLLVYPDELMHWELVDKHPNMEAKNKVFNVIKVLAEMDFTTHGAVKADGDPVPFFRFDDEAQEIFNDWYTVLHRDKLRDSAEDSIIVEHLSKYSSLMPSLALLLHLVDVAQSKAKDTVSARAAKQAVVWCKYLESHVRRVYGMFTSIAQRAAVQLSKKILAGVVKNKFSARDIYRNGWSYLDDTDLVLEACEILVDMGWLRLIIVPPSETGGRGANLFEINPKIKRR